MTEPTRKPYHGSCHCGHIKYLVYLTLPPSITTTTTTTTTTITPSSSSSPSTTNQPQPQPTTRFYKCNCSTCHKTGFFHTRPSTPSTDFYLLSPTTDLTDPTEMGDYMCIDRLLHWYFCPRCGVRCFISEGCWREDEVDLGDVGVALPERFGGGDGDGDGKMRRKVLRMDMEGLRDDQMGYLSVNALTLDRGQVGGPDLDLRELVDRKWLRYLDCKDEEGEPRVEYPQEGGTW